MSRMIEIARRLDQLGQTENVLQAYRLALGSGEELEPAEMLEAALYIFQYSEEYKIPFTVFVQLYNEGQFQEEILDLMLQAFYLPNLKKQQKQYEKNCNALKDYPYLFQKDFLSFDDRKIWFFPFDNEGFVPFYLEENRFGDYVNFNDPVIDRWFFKDLSKPVLAENVYSQYQLEYLNDMVRPSEWVARENHIYLHYASWEEFCSYLSVLNFKKLLNDEKIVILIGEESNRYPIDFKKEYGIDYTQYPVRPVGIREVHKLVWHTQLATHNGGDFFNEICYDHPNMIVIDSVMFEKVVESHTIFKNKFLQGQRDNDLYRALAQIKNPTDKDIFVGMYLYEVIRSSRPDPASRIVPAIFFQPHFYNIKYEVEVDWQKNHASTLYSKQYEELRTCSFLKGFKYIKTFTPMRRPTTSHAASVRFAIEQPAHSEKEKEEEKDRIIPDLVTLRLLNRSFMVNPWDRFYHDSRLVRFEDGKLNPKATFTALAEFLDIPYTKSMTYCSGREGINPESLQGNDLGFSLAAIQRTYPEYANDEERAFIEYFFRDAYQLYGYDFQYYKEEPVDETWVKDKIEHFTTIDGWIKKVLENYFEVNGLEVSKQLLKNNIDIESLRNLSEENEQSALEQIKNQYTPIFVNSLMNQMHETRLNYALAQLHNLNFVNREGQPLQLMTPLKLDPELLEQPLYH